MTEDFEPRFPWIGGDLQTLRNYLRPGRPDLSSWPGEKLLLDLGDGDRMHGVLHAEGKGPLVVLVHGLTGCEESHYLRATAGHLLSAGYPVLRLSLRGAGPSRPHCRGQYNAGRGGDIHLALSALERLRPGILADGICAVGYSLGANILIAFLAAAGRDWPLRAGVAVSAPIDLKAAQEQMMRPRNWLYHRYLLGRMKREALATPGGLELGYAEAVRNAASVLAFDDRFVAPRGGYANAEHYYAHCSGERHLPRVEAPLLLIHAEDDPWIPADAYRRVAALGQPNLEILLTGAGGHVGYHGTGSTVPWHDRRIAMFLRKTLG